MLIGYAKVLFEDPDLGSQVARLRAVGATRIVEERTPAGRWGRPEFLQMLEDLGPGDTVVVCGLECLARNLKDVFVLLEKVDRTGAGFRSLAETFDSTTPAGRDLLTMIRRFAEFERKLVLRRTKDGASAARLRGAHVGRPPKLNAEQRAQIVEMVISEGYTPAEAARWFGVHRSTVSRILSEARER